MIDSFIYFLYVVKGHLYITYKVHCIYHCLWSFSCSLLVIFISSTHPWPWIGTVISEKRSVGNIYKSWTPEKKTSTFCIYSGRTWWHNANSFAQISVISHTIMIRRYIISTSKSSWLLLLVPFLGLYNKLLPLVWMNGTNKF